MRARRNTANFCPPGQSNCARAQQFVKLDNQGDTQYKADVAHAQRNYNSIVFNTFIFLQVNLTTCIKVHLIAQRILSKENKRILTLHSN